MRGRHLVKHWSVTQSVVTLSSAEAELGGITKGASTSLGLIAVAKDLGMVWDLTLQTDSTAAVGICRRRGLGNILHLATTDLWAQYKSRAHDVELRMVTGKDIPADMMTNTS